MIDIAQITMLQIDRNVQQKIKRQNGHLNAVCRFL